MVNNEVNSSWAVGRVSLEWISSVSETLCLPSFIRIDTVDRSRRHYKSCGRIILKWILKK